MCFKRIGCSLKDRCELLTSSFEWHKKAPVWLYSQWNALTSDPMYRQASHSVGLFLELLLWHHSQGSSGRQLAQAVLKKEGVWTNKTILKIRSFCPRLRPVSVTLWSWSQWKPWGQLELIFRMPSVKKQRSASIFNLHMGTFVWIFADWCNVKYISSRKVFICPILENSILGRARTAFLKFRILRFPPFLMLMIIEWWLYANHVM